ncbi:MAG: TIGR02221 family CRISPR-associated protein [Candidatus Cloacimonetes bacterium]|nr:TIGR02221 family CRISPR-associated protein [Candidatus Cloacimonadota bacterium]
MPKVLISFLGTNNHKPCAYQNSNVTSRITPYVQEALCEVHQISKAVVLCTEESQAKNWNELSQRLSQSGVEAVHRRMPNCSSPQELWDLFKILQTVISEHDGYDIYLDITHSFRHLPMLSLMAAILAKSLKKVQIGGIYYGAMEMIENSVTPVLYLQGLLDIHDWIVGLKLLEETGSIKHLESPLSNYLSKSNQNELIEGDYFERIMQLGWASQGLQNVYKELKKEADPDSVFSLVQDDLLSQIQWHSYGTLQKRQTARAWHYLSHRDYVRSVLFTVEAVITGSLPENQQKNFDKRETNRKDLCKRTQEFKTLCHLRNTLAHAANPEGQVPEITKREDKLYTWLDKTYRTLTNQKLLPSLGRESGGNINDKN